jgi:hypothetical protein
VPSITQGTDPSGIEDAMEALDETDHTRLPTWLVAKIAVVSASRRWREDYESRVVRPLRQENRRLRSELARLRAQPRLRKSG